MTAITQQDTPQTETPKLQHITTTNRPQPLQHQYYRISSTRFHTSAQETVGSGALVSAWLFLGNTIPLPRWQRMELFRQKFRQGKISPPFLTAKFSLRNSPLAKFSLPLYLTPVATAHGGPAHVGVRPGIRYVPRESIRRSLECSVPVLPLDQPQPCVCVGGAIPGGGGGGGQFEGFFGGPELGGGTTP